VIAVIFEVWPAEGERQQYMDLAAERFGSLTDEGKLLSLSFWRDEAAVTEWRRQEAHRATQGKGRAGVFRDYRLRVAEVARDYGLTERDKAPDDSRAIFG
jgi:Antibiotic biosynthesis monooxygenase